jgi:single-strand DNA-binding protein
MAEGINKVLLLGIVGESPAPRAQTGGPAECEFQLATTDRYTGRDGTAKEITDQHTVVAWGRQAEVAQRELGQGRLVFVEGRLQTRTWEEPDGKKKKVTEVLAHRLIPAGEVPDADGVNTVLLLGNVGQDPELRYTGGGQAVCDLRLATTARYPGKDGQIRESTDWHTVIVWGKQGENVKQYLAKGRQAFVEGRVKTRSWTDRDGNPRLTTEVVASRVIFVGGGGARRSEGYDDAPPPPSDRDLPPSAGGDDDIPF